MKKIKTMNTGTACAIFKQLDSDKYTDREKAIAIYTVMNMETHNSIQKYYMIKAIKWLWRHNRYDIKEVGDT